MTEDSKAAMSDAGLNPGSSSKEEVIRKRRCELRFLRCFRMFLRLLGGAASVAFVIFGIWDLVNIEVHNFWQFCRWAGRWLLGLIGGVWGCYLEAQGHAVVPHFTRFAVNRIGTAIFYVWMGFYLMGADFAGSREDSHWGTAMRVTGGIAWAVAFGNLMISCTSQGAAEVDPALSGSVGKTDKHEEHNNQDPEAGHASTGGERHPTGGWNNVGVRPFGAM